MPGTFGRYFSDGAPAHPPYPTRRTIPRFAGQLSMRAYFVMARTYPTPSLRRLAIFLVAIALVAAISPGLALAANGPPRPVDDVINTPENTPASGNVLANDGNQGDDPLVVTAVGPLAPSIGTLSIDADGDYVFTPADDWNGSANTTYTVTNGKVRTGNIMITVTPANDAPVANDDTITVVRGHGDRRHGPAAGQRHRPRWRHAGGRRRLERLRRKRPVGIQRGDLHARQRRLRRRQRLLRLRHQRRQRWQRQRERDGRRHLHKRRTRGCRRHCHGHRGHAGDD